jgi:hypothetical protein
MIPSKYVIDAKGQWKENNMENQKKFEVNGVMVDSCCCAGAQITGEPKCCDKPINFDAPVEVVNWEDYPVTVLQVLDNKEGKPIAAIYEISAPPGRRLLSGPRIYVSTQMGRLKRIWPKITEEDLDPGYCIRNAAKKFEPLTVTQFVNVYSNDCFEAFDSKERADKEELFGGRAALLKVTSWRSVNEAGESFWSTTTTVLEDNP